MSGAITPLSYTLPYRVQGNIICEFLFIDVSFYYAVGSWVYIAKISEFGKDVQWSIYYVSWGDTLGFSRRRRKSWNPHGPRYSGQELYPGGRYWVNITVPTKRPLPILYLPLFPSFLSTRLHHHAFLIKWRNDQILGTFKEKKPLSNIEEYLISFASFAVVFKWLMPV
jgi:hypothetical protein